MIKIRTFWLALVLSLGAVAAVAQGTSVALQGEVHDATLPVEVTAEELTVDQSSSSAVFSGNAKVVQGAMNLSADSIRIEYDTESGGISQVEASGNVTFTNGAEMAEAQNARYQVGAAEISLTGGVLLLQGQTTIAGDALVLDLSGNTGTMRGNVKTVFTPATNK